jgi:hypothetical protein
VLLSVSEYKNNVSMKKKVNGILLLLVLCLWGAVGYKTIKNYFNSNNTVNKIENNRSIETKQIRKDTFQLEKIVRDPFLNKQAAEPKSIVASNYNWKPKNIPKKSLPSVSAEPLDVTINWPQISYYGFIKSKNKSEEMILVKIDTQLHKLRKNSSINGVFIHKVYRDSIEVNFNKQRKVIKIN